MAFKKGKKKTGGRSKGTPNVLTKTVREVVLNTFNELQAKPGVNLTDWAEENPKDFYLIASKLIPTEITTSGKLVINVKVPE